MPPIITESFFGNLVTTQLFWAIQIAWSDFDNPINVYLAFLLQQTDAQHHLINNI